MPSLVEFGNANMTAEAAETTANKFEGFGPNIYRMEQQEWVDMLGRNGRGLYAMILAMRDEEGVVPKCLEITHGN